MWQPGAALYAIFPGMNDSNKDNPSKTKKALRSLGRKPKWLAVPPPWGAEFAQVRRTLRSAGLHTVCEEARCPNIGECFGRHTATFLLLGGNCSRSCTFCNISTGLLTPPDPAEPTKVAQAVKQLGLTWAVITSVTRDDLDDGGATHFAKTIREIKRLAPGTSVEVLIPDFQGEPSALDIVLAAEPTVLNHNIETISRLFPVVRPQGDYERSLTLLSRAAGGPSETLIVKSGLMVGLGESNDEVETLLDNLRQAGCQAVTIGQYLPPSPEHAHLRRYVTPETFDAWADSARAKGFSHVFSAPLVRSSYHASSVGEAIQGDSGEED